MKKPTAEKVGGAKVAAASGTAGGAKPGLGRVVEAAMLAATAKCAEDGITDPAEIIERKLAAREDAKRIFNAEGTQAMDPLEVDTPITYYNNVAGAPAPNPTIGTVTEVTGDNDYSVSVQNPNDSYRTEEHVGQKGVEGTDGKRYIELREGAYEPPADAEPASL